MTALRAAVVFALAAAVVAAPVPKAVKAKPPNLDGRWEIVELNSGGSDVTKLNPWVWDVKGEQLTIYNSTDGKLTPNDPTTVTTLVRPPTGEANHLDYHRKYGSTDNLYPAIVAVDGDTLTVCYAEDAVARPTEYKTGRTVALLRFKRVKEPK